MGAAEVIAALGGSADTGMCRCPCHDDGRPSLHVADGNNGKLLLYCHAGCRFEDIASALAQRGVLRRNEPRTIRRKPKNTTPKTADIARGLLHAADMSRERPRDYLANRGISIVPRNLKIVDATTMRRLAGFLLPAMVAPIEKDGEVIGAHATILTRDAAMNAKGRGGSVRRFYGRASGGLVVLDEADPDRSFIVGEGVESVLSAMQLTDLSGAAALSAVNLSKVELPPCAEVIVAADADNVGMGAATRLADRLARAGRVVRIAAPDSGDWNDQLQLEKDQSDAA